MKRLLAGLVVMLFLSGSAFAAFDSLDGHKKYIYPIVRVSAGMDAGSGTIIYSKPSEGSDKYSTYVLTNHHVIDFAIVIKEEWDSNLGKNRKVERRGLVYVEIFKYRNISVPVGTMKVESDIILYNQAEDMALLKLRFEEKLDYVAKLPPIEGLDDYHVLDESIAVGCSLSFPPLPTTGIITRLNFQFNSLPYHMSSSQIIYGNSGGAMFLTNGMLIGIPSLVAIIGWGTPVTHMGLFIPISRVEKWLNEQHLDFIFDPSQNEKECFEQREKSIKEKEKRGDGLYVP